MAVLIFSSRFEKAGAIAEAVALAIRAADEARMDAALDGSLLSAVLLWPPVRHFDWRLTATIEYEGYNRGDTEVISREEAEKCGLFLKDLGAKRPNVRIDNRWGDTSPRDLQGSSWDEKRYHIPKDYVPEDEW